MRLGGISSSSSLIAALGLAWIAWAPPARADYGAYAVYTGAEPSALASADVAALLARMDPPVSLAAPPAHLSSLLDAADLRIVGGARATYCEARPLDPGSLDDKLTTIQHLLDEVRLEEADLLLAQLAEVHACYPLRPGSLALAHESFLAGILAFYRDDAASVRSHFRAALARNPDLPWDDNYPPSAQQWFAEALLEVLREESSTLALDLPPGKEVWIDGTAQETGNSTITTRPGLHLVHVGTAADGYSSVEVSLESAATATLVTGEALGRPDALSGDAGLVVQLITGEIAGRGLSEAYVVRLPGEVWSVDPHEGALVPMEAPPGVVVTVDDPRKRSKVHPLGPVLMAAGAALAVGGGVMAGLEREQAMALHGAIEGLTEDDGSLNSMLTSFERHRSASYAGWGLLAGGGACVAVGIPLTLQLRRPVEVTVGVAAEMGDAPGFWGLQLSVQPVGGRR